MSPIKNFHLIIDALNEDGTFSAGDAITGTVTFSLTKTTKVKSLYVKAKGDANVRWTEGSAEDETTYSDQRRYFKAKQDLVAADGKGTELPQGVHNLRFRLLIPHGDMPPSFKGKNGTIVYMVEAKLTRSWRWPSIVSTEINFVSKSYPHIGQVMCPQSGSVSKELGTFSKGQVQMFATVNRKVWSPGDTLSAVAKVCNSSSKSMKPKFSLQQKMVYRAGSHTNTSTKVLFKMVADTIPPNSEVTTSCQVKIPNDASYSLHNCEIISVEYYLKVYLDVSFAFDPEVVFPLVIVPSSSVTIQTAENVFGVPSLSDFPPPALPVGLNPFPAGPGPSMYPEPVPTQYTNIASGYHNQWPQTGASYGFSATTSALSSLQHPTAPPQFQQGDDPPSYSSLSLFSTDPLGRSGSDHKS